MAARDAGMATRMLTPTCRPIIGAAAQPPSPVGKGHPRHLAPVRPPTGELVGRFGRYEILKRQGRWGMSTSPRTRSGAWRSRRSASIRTPPAGCDRAEAAVLPRGADRREALAPNIVTIYDVDRRDGLSYIVMGA
jgi:hypothetical protein